MDPFISAFITTLSAFPILGPFIPYVPLVMLACSVADAAFPQPAVGSKWVCLRRIVSTIGLSVGNARNAVPAGVVPASVAQHAAEVKQAAQVVEEVAGTLAQTVEGQVEAALNRTVSGKP